MPTLNFSLRNLSILGLGMLLLGGCSTEDSLTSAAQRGRSSTQEVQQPSLEPAVRLAHQYILIGNNDELPGDLMEQTWDANGTVTGTMPEVGLALVSSDDPNFEAKARKIWGVKHVIHDFSYQTPTVRTTAYSSPRTTAVMPWARPTSNTSSRGFIAATTSKRTLVAVLGRGNQLLPAFSNHVVGSTSFVPGEDAVAVAPTATTATKAKDTGVLVVKVVGNTGSGSLGWLLQGLYYAAAQRASIVSLDLATAVAKNTKFRDDNGTPYDESDDKWISNPQEVQMLMVAISKVMNYASQRGVAVTAPAKHMKSNGNQRLVHIPADLPNVVAITPQSDLAMLQPTPVSRN